MIYRIYIRDNKTGERSKHEQFNSLELAQNKVEKSYKKRNAEIIAIPENIGVGYKCYRNGELYGEIVSEDDSFYWIQRAKKGESDKAFFIKDDFIQKFENKIFDAAE